MLQYRAVYPETLGLLKRLMKVPELQDFFLVGGTALALHLGHRISVDIDLFTLNEFDSAKIYDKLKDDFDIFDKAEDLNTLNLHIGNPETTHTVKVDLIRYSYPLINPVIESNGIRLLSVEDIIPMKLSAIAGRGSKKDFYDIYFLLQEFTYEQMFEMFEQKFSATNKFHIIKSLLYFDDADIEPDPITTEPSDWNEIKKAVIRKTNEYVRT